MPATVMASLVQRYVMRSSPSCLEVVCDLREQVVHARAQELERDDRRDGVQEDDEGILNERLPLFTFTDTCGEQSEPRPQILHHPLLPSGRIRSARRLTLGI